MAEDIENYALIGDCETAALVSRSGSIDWFCLPRFDSGAVFAALLGGPGNGRWLLCPEAPATAVRRRYVPGTLVLETDFETAEGAITLVDFMLVREQHPYLLRMVRGRRGQVRMRMELILRFDYGNTIPWVTKLDGAGLRAISGPDMVAFYTDQPVTGVDRTSVAEFVVASGQTISFTLAHTASHLDLPAPIDVEAALQDTCEGWKRWAARSQYSGPYEQAVERSLITLKALTYRPTGAIVAAPTTSLPEQLGGVRNWDYRFCWLRDATLTLLSLMNAGYYDEAEAWRAWLERSAAGSAEQLQVLYGVAGERRLAEFEVPWLAGYQGARPVRVGNAAAAQLQLDVYGEISDALFQARCGGLPSDGVAWALQRELTEHLEAIWHEPDEGIWEVRGGRQQFTYSKIMAWVALDRAVRAIEAEEGLEGPIDRWRELRTRIHADVCQSGYDASRNTFVQRYGGKAVDASLLLIPSTGFLPPEDPRVRGTLAAIERELLRDGFVLRYNTEQTDDGLPPREGAFLACSFWLADAYILQNRREEARALFERLLELRNDVGLLSEEYDPVAGRLVGNFPQAFSHIGLINTAFNLRHATGPARQRAPSTAA